MRWSPSSLALWAKLPVIPIGMEEQHLRARRKRVMQRLVQISDAQIRADTLGSRCFRPARGRGAKIKTKFLRRDSDMANDSASTDEPLDQALNFPVD
jgi:hypothetical protein